jgi:hypothetical protein
MRCRPDRLTWNGRSGLVLLLGLIWIGLNPVLAKQHGGGSGSAASLTREELTRSWDLNGDGTISKPEAEVARARMKRERIEMQLGGGIDPLTGLPRSQDDELEEQHTPGDEPEFRLPPEEPPLPSRHKPSAGLPGFRAPSLAPPMITAPIPSTGRGPVPSLNVPRIDPSQPTARLPGAAPPGRSTGASWLSPNARGSALTGGVRAGAPAAVPGYGSGPWSDLNAARSRYAPTPIDLPRTGASGLGASGLGVSPRRTGSILLPGGIPGQAGLGPSLSRPTAPLPSVTRPMAPPPPLVQPPRISAEEMGGY